MSSSDAAKNQERKASPSGRSSGRGDSQMGGSVQRRASCELCGGEAVEGPGSHIGSRSPFFWNHTPSKKRVHNVFPLPVPLSPFPLPCLSQTFHRNDVSSERELAREVTKKEADHPIVSFDFFLGILSLPRSTHTHTHAPQLLLPSPNLPPSVVFREWD